jgi:hypothetical protein
MEVATKDFAFDNEIKHYLTYCMSSPYFCMKQLKTCMNQFRPYYRQNPEPFQKSVTYCRELRLNCMKNISVQILNSFSCAEKLI